MCAQSTINYFSILFLWLFVEAYLYLGSLIINGLKLFWNVTDCSVVIVGISAIIHLSIVLTLSWYLCINLYFSVLSIILINVDKLKGNIVRSGY